MISTSTPFSKQMLRSVLGISKSTLNRRIKYLMSNILELQPNYNEASQILRKDIFILICDDFGWSRNDVLNRIKIFIPGYKDTDIMVMQGIFGL